MRPPPPRVRVPLPQSGGSRAAKVKDITAGTGEEAAEEEGEEEVFDEYEELDEEPLTGSLARTNSRNSQASSAHNGASSPLAASAQRPEGEASDSRGVPLRLPRSTSSLSGSRARSRTPSAHGPAAGGNDTPASAASGAAQQLAASLPRPISRQSRTPPVRAESPKSTYSQTWSAGEAANSPRNSREGSLACTGTSKQSQASSARAKSPKQQSNTFEVLAPEPVQPMDYQSGRSHSSLSNSRGRQSRGNTGSRASEQRGEADSSQQRPLSSLQADSQQAEAGEKEPQAGSPQASEAGAGPQEESFDEGSLQCDASWVEVQPETGVAADAAAGPPVNLDLHQEGSVQVVPDEPSKSPPADPQPNPQLQPDPHVQSELQLQKQEEEEQQQRLPHVQQQPEQQLPHVQPQPVKEQQHPQPQPQQQPHRPKQQQAAPKASAGRPPPARGSSSAPPAPKPRVPVAPAPKAQHAPPQPKRKAQGGRSPMPRARSEPPAPDPAQGQLAKLVSEVTAHLQDPSEPLDEKGWLQETAQLELYVEEMKWLMSQQMDPRPQVAQNGAANQHGGYPGHAAPGQFVPEQVRKRDVSVLQWDKDLRWAKQQLKRCEQEYNLLQARLASIDPVMQEQLATDIRHVDEEIAAEHKRQKLQVAENRQRERSLVRNAVDGHEIDAKTRALQQIERWEAELAVWKVKNNSSHKQVQEAGRLLQKAQENRKMLGQKAQHIEAVLNSDEFAARQAELREAQEKWRNEETALQASLAELQEQRVAVQRSHERKRRERSVELRQLTEERRVLEEREKQAEAAVRGLRRQQQLTPQGGQGQGRGGGAGSRSASPRPARAPSSAAVTPSSARREHSGGRSPPRGPSQAQERGGAKEEVSDANLERAYDHPSDRAEPVVAAAAASSYQPAWPTPPEGFEDTVQQETARLSLLLPQGRPRLCVLGSAVMHGQDTAEVAKAIAAKLATLSPDGLTVVTGGNMGVQETFAKNFSSSIPLFHLVLSGQGTGFDFGKDLEVQGEALLKSAVIGELGDLYVTLEGGPRVAEEARRAILRGAIVLPISRTGGASRGEFGFPPAALKCPAGVTASQWRSLQEAVSPLETADAVSDAVRAILSL